MKLSSIRWRLAFSYAAIALLAAFSLGFVLRTILRSYYDTQEARYLQERAMRIGLVTAQLIDAQVPAQLLQDQSASWSFFLQARVRIEDGSGNLIADSGIPDNRNAVFFTSAIPFQVPVDSSLAVPDMRTESFEVQIIQGEAASTMGQQGDFVIFSPDSVGVVMPADESMYGLFNYSEGTLARRSSQAVRQPIMDEDGTLLGWLILSDGPAYGDEILNNVMNGWVISSIVAILLAALAGWFVSNRITTPITALTQTTARMAAGDLSARANVASNDEMGRLGHSFNEMASQVEEMVGTLRSFVSDAAHELHTPLTALQTNLELARDEKNASARTRYLVRAQEQGQRLEAMVSNLLDLSRIESTEGRAGFLPVNLSMLLGEIAEHYASRAEQSNRPLALDLPDEPIVVLGNEAQLNQVFINLLENALKFTREHDSIYISAAASEKRVVMEVTDTGIGIPVDDLPNIFKRFHRGRNVSEIAGNGLGLAIVRAVVEQHGGSVTVASEGVGRGSKFTIILPARL